MAGLSNLKNLTQLANAAKGRQSKEVLTLRVEDVVSKPQVRKTFKNLEELAATLRTEGQQSPIIVSPKREDGKYVIQKGERRWRACKLAGIETIDVIVNEKDQTDLDETAGELIENIQRENLSPLEIAEGLKSFVDAGWKQKDIAERIGKTVPFVSTHLSLLKLPDCVRELYEAEITGDTETLNNLRLLYELNPERCRAICAVALNEGISRKQSRDALNDAKRAVELKERAQSEDASDSQVEQPAAAPSEETEAKTRTPFSDGDDASEQGAESLDIDSGDSADEGADSAPATRQAKEPAKREEKPQTAPADAPANEGWRAVRPETLLIAVNVWIDGSVHTGVLMTDRVSDDPEMVWVTLTDHDAGEAPVRVAATDVELVRIEG